jgi:hypothetical protein
MGHITVVSDDSIDVQARAYAEYRMFAADPTCMRRSTARQNA